MSLEKKNLAAQQQPQASAPLMATGPSPPTYMTPRTLHIYRDGFTARHMTVTDMDKSHALYQVHCNHGTIFSSKPHMRVTAPSSSSSSSSNAPILGTATFHSWSRRVDITVGPHSAELARPGFFTRSLAYVSPAFGGQTLTWQCDGIFGSDLVLVNEQKEWLAKFDHAAFSWSKEGKLHIVNGSIGGLALDEIVTTGFAMMIHERRRKQNSGGGGGGA
ncbi:MAG: hypothetical protein LQ342_002997 [Letrouitia transgressa]|nr:MAG: hypothetical protein LQ342_002997 [Letrouitia transgressa]